MCGNEDDEEVDDLVGQVIENLNSEGDYVCGHYDMIWGQEEVMDDDSNDNSTDYDGSELRE